MYEEPSSLLDDLRTLRDDLGPSGVLLALVVLGGGWVAVCWGGAYL